MNKPIKILHIDHYYKATYFINRPGSLIRSLVPLEEAINLLKNEKIDLILSEPHNKAILALEDYGGSSQFKEDAKISGSKSRKD